MKLVRFENSGKGPEKGEKADHSENKPMLESWNNFFSGGFIFRKIKVGEYRHQRKLKAKNREDIYLIGAKFALKK